MADERLRKSDRIRGAKAYIWHYRQSWRTETKALVFYFKAFDSEEICLGFSVSRKVGNAVQRNRIKRRLREIFRKQKEIWRLSNNKRPTGYQMVIQPKTIAAECSYRELEQQMKKAVERFLKNHLKRLRPIL